MPVAIHTRARIELFSGNVSGKTRGYSSGVRPNHYIAQLGTNVIGNVSFEGDGVLNLGETKTARVDFMYFAALKDLLAPGFEWEIREGTNPVGKGTIVEIVGDT